MSSFDISTAFLRSNKIVGDVYSEIPPGLEELLPVGKGEVLKLKRGVYGLAD